MHSIVTLFMYVLFRFMKWESYYNVILSRDNFFLK